MIEHDVWKFCVEYIKNTNGTIYAACPPGGSSIYPRFMLYNPITNKRDEPDLLATINNELYIIEAKPTCELCFKRGLKTASNESDYDKLLRIFDGVKAGIYDKQFLENYLINIKDYNIHIGITYNDESTSVTGPFWGLDHFIVSDLGVTSLVSR